MRNQNNRIYRFEYDRWNLVQASDLKPNDLICFDDTTDTHTDIAERPDEVARPSCLGLAYIAYETTNLATNEKFLIAVDFATLEEDRAGYFDDVCPYKLVGLKRNHWDYGGNEHLSEFGRSAIGEREAWSVKFNSKKELKYIEAFRLCPAVQTALAEFEDGTFMFADLYHGRGQIYSPRLTLLDLDAWCKKNIGKYKKLEKLVDPDDVDFGPPLEITPWWY